MEDRWNTAAAYGGVRGVDGEIIFMKVVFIIIAALLLYGLIMTSGNKKKEED